MLFYVLQLFFCVIATCCSLNYLCAWDLSGALTPLVGYRSDQITTTLNTFDGSQLFEINQMTVKDIDVFELGIRGRVSLNQCWSLRGVVSWGLIPNGEYHEDLSDLGFQNQKNVADVEGRLSQDEAVSLGYAYPLSQVAAIEVLAGWSYNKLLLKMRDFQEEGLPETAINKLYYSTQWQGPWIGCALAYDRCGLCSYVSYEFHLPHWKAQYWLSDYRPAFSVILDRRWANNTHGHVVFLDVSYVFWQCCSIGLRTQFQYWIAKNGHSELMEAKGLVPQGVPEGQVTRVTKATWRSLGLQINLGVVF